MAGKLGAAIGIRTSTSERVLGERLGRTYCYLICLGISDEAERVELFSDTVVEMSSQIRAGERSTIALLVAAHQQLAPSIKDDGEWRWDVRDAMRQLTDVPVNASLVAVPFGVGVGIFSGFVANRRVGATMGAASMFLALTARSLYSMQRGIRGNLPGARSPLDETRLATVANVVTMLRLIPIGALVPVFAAREDDRSRATAAYAVLLASLPLDGALARKMDQETNVGLLLNAGVDRMGSALAALGLLGSTWRRHRPIAGVALGTMAALDVTTVVIGTTFRLVETSPQPNRAGHFSSLFAYYGLLLDYTTRSHRSLNHAPVRMAATSAYLTSIAIRGVSLWNYRRAMANGIYWSPRESFSNSRIPPRLLSAALEKLKGPLDGPLRKRLVDLSNTTDSSRRDPGTPLSMVRRALRSAKSDLETAQRDDDVRKQQRLEYDVEELTQLEKALCRTTDARRQQVDDITAPLSMEMALAGLSSPLDQPLGELLRRIVDDAPPADRDRPPIELVVRAMLLVETDLDKAQTDLAFGQAAELDYRLNELKDLLTRLARIATDRAGDHDKDTVIDLTGITRQQDPGSRRRHGSGGRRFVPAFRARMTATFGVLRIFLAPR